MTLYSCRTCRSYNRFTFRLKHVSFLCAGKVGWPGQEDDDDGYDPEQGHEYSDAAEAEPV